MGFCETIVDEWVRSGVTDAVIAPGSRSTPLALALFSRLKTTVVLDERSAGYRALGLALATGRPTVVVCTSGTAATHLYGTVVEASASGVPLIVCTADRPPELHHIGAPQTIDQTHLFGHSVRWFCEPGPPEQERAHTWRSIGSRAAAEATGRTPGPVHLNLAFREPLIADNVLMMPPGRANGDPWHRVPDLPTVVDPPQELVALTETSRRPIVISGHGAPQRLFATGVPILGDHRGPHMPNVAHVDLMARVPKFIASHAPDLIIRLGMPPSSKALHQWVDNLDVPQICVQPQGTWIDPARCASWMVHDPIGLSLSGEAGWLDSWQQASHRAATAINDVFAARDTLCEPLIAREIAAYSPMSTLVVSSSMPIRDLEAFGTPRANRKVFSNRGANGIDGVTSTAIGVALSGTPTTLLIGDLAFLHDSNALLRITELPIDLTIVIIDNNGGGIFSLLPQHEALDPFPFDTLFGTPQGINISELLTLHGVPVTTASTRDQFGPALDGAARVNGVRAVIAHTDREENVAVHQQLADVVAKALE